MSDTRDSWHFDKRVPVSIIGVLLVNLIGVAWILAVMHSEIAANRTDIVRIDRTVGIISNASNGQAVQLGRIEEQVVALRSDIGRLLNVLAPR